MLLYKGGAVCKNYFSDNSASAICKELGYTRAMSWTSNGDIFYNVIDPDYKNKKELAITLDRVNCFVDEWSSCTYSTSPDSSSTCWRGDFVFLTCSKGTL